MKCPKCKNLDTKVIDSRIAEDGKTIRRRRECEKCGSRFTTFERMEFVSFLVTKTNGEQELYDRSKVERSIEKAVHRRQVDHTAIEAAINELENEWAANKKGITSKRIGRDILRKLKDIDQVAYVRFASIYHNFEDVRQFADFIRSEFDE
jgi:transcriptional repressor NrdR